MPTPRTLDQAKHAAKKLREALPQPMGEPEVKLAAAQAMVALALGYASWPELSRLIGSTPAPSDGDVEKALRSAIAARYAEADEEEIVEALEVLTGGGPDVQTGTEALRLARPSAAFSKIAAGVHPLVGDQHWARHGTLRIDGGPGGLTGRCMVHAHSSETGTLRIVDLSFEAHDDAGLAAALWGTLFVPYDIGLEDHDAIMGADETSDDDVQVITSLVSAMPGFFEDGTGVLHLDGVEVRPDRRRQGIGSAILRTALLDLQRRWASVGSVVHSPERAGAGQPSFRVVDDARRQVAESVAAFIEGVAGGCDMHAGVIGMMPTRGRLQTLMDVDLVMRGGEPGMGVEIDEDELETRLYGRRNTGE